jgi:hypothetical protein
VTDGRILHSAFAISACLRVLQLESGFKNNVGRLRTMTARFAGTPEPNELLHVFTPDFRVMRYEEPIAETEWFPRKSTLVRMVARRL